MTSSEVFGYLAVLFILAAVACIPIPIAGRLFLAAVVCLLAADTPGEKK